jgi:hypothetical protein
MNYLLHASNIVYLASYLVKDILWLRILTIVGVTMIIVFFLSQPAPLWAAVGWNVVFGAINVGQIYLLVLERRPVRLAEHELRLYQLAFRALSPREFVKLLALARWDDVPGGQRLVTQGADVDRMMVIFSGVARVEIAGRTVAELGRGQFVGEMSFVTGDAPTADVVTCEPARIVSWQKTALKELLSRNSELGAAMQTVIGADLVGKLKLA